MKNIILGVTGSIAAYKAADIANTLAKEGHSVHVIMTSAALRFITPLTFQTLTKNKVYTGLFDEFIYEDVRHISLARQADLALVAPAGANIIGKLAAGIADDMLSTVLMALESRQMLICPAMNTAMYENPIVQENIKKLTGYGCRFVEPREARLACGDMGRGALAGTSAIIEAVRDMLRDSK
ncbi:MAG: phosphopantothenoylcysteine decarboxylase [Spirochaetaceae bacterium]|jgi:phosphopantothenoylcysteine decarboxylase/phosphopantothenoylcysteine decarboxylase/phosphopantothenate--cysteine ligase|nr:phosphopantothenoylcysteine decarboxylase [Spirochaetaceae bacterium]